MVCECTDKATTACEADSCSYYEKMATITQTTTRNLRVRSKPDDLTIRSLEYADTAAARYLFVDGMRSLIPSLFWAFLYHPIYIAVLVAACAGLLFSFSLNVALFFLAAALAATYALSYYKFYEYIAYCLRDDLADIEKYYLKRPRSNFWVAELDGQIVGIVALDEKSADTGELRRMSVDSRVRGRGIARKLVDNLIDFSREQGYKEVVLGTSSLQVPAIGLYKKYGFSLTSRMPLFMMIKVNLFRYEL